VEASLKVCILKNVLHSVEASMGALQLSNNVESIEVNESGPAIGRMSELRGESLNVNEVL